MWNIKKAKQKILESKEIIIACHINPDGDCIGSLLALGLGLKKLGKRVYMVSPEGVPKPYKLLPAANYIIKKFTKSVDLAIAVDCGSKTMLGKMIKTFEKAKIILEIDHHEFRVSFGHISLVEPSQASVGELVCKLLNELKITFTKDIAQNILTSIIVETNSFRLPAVSEYTFKVCARLMKTGLNFHKLTELVYWSGSKESAILSGICLSRCKFLKDNKIVWSIVFKEDFRKTHGKNEDVDAVPIQMLSIKDVEVSAFFREENHHLLRVSLRSKGKVNVAHISEIYGGGGHFDSAGCIIPNFPKSIKELLSILQKRWNVYNKNQH